MLTEATENVTGADTRRDSNINLRVSQPEKELIDTAASVIGKTRTQFVIETATRHAIDVLLDQRLFRLGDEQWEEFMAALDKPPLPNKQLKELMARTPPWEK